MLSASWQALCAAMQRREAVGASRGKGEGSFNYVVFDDADIEILEENGKPVKTNER